MLNTLARISALLVLVTVLAVAGLHGGQAMAGTNVFTVTKTADTADGTCDSDCSLREAIIAANGLGTLTTTGLAAAPTIQLPAGTYTLSIPGTGENAALTGDLDITAAVDIVGAGPDTTIIDGANLDTVFDVRSTGNLGLGGVTVQHGKDPGTGGIFASGPLTLTNVHISNNKGEGTDQDGATGGVTIQTIGTITDSLFFMNTATGNSTGGLWGKAGSTITVKNTTFDSNSVNGSYPTGALGSHGDTTLDGVTVKNNTAAGQDALAGFYSDGTTTIRNSQFLNNDVTDDYGVGAILNRGTMTIWDTTVDGNDAAYGGAGGILSLPPDSGPGSLTLRRVAVSNNSAGDYGTGGIWIETPAFLGEVAIDHNFATDDATGGVEFYNADPVQLSRVAITNNSAGTYTAGGVFLSGASNVTMDDSWVDHNTVGPNSVGGIDVAHGSTLVANRVAVTNNSTSGDTSTGGVSVYQSTATLTNTTISGNSAVGNATGGAYVEDGTLTINFTTIDDNSAGVAGGVGGLTSYGTLHISNSIVGLNPGENSCWQTAGASTGHNIDQGNDCGFSRPTDMHNTDPMLGSLADNGGFSPTQALTGNSPAANAAGACALDSDQRVFPRPQGNACDIGAFELGSLSTTDRAWGDTLCSNGVGGDDALAGIAAVAGVTLSQPLGSACPALSQDVYVGGWFTSHLWGDWDCDGAVNLLDALRILSAAAEVATTPTNPCPDMGATVPIG